MSEFKKKAEAAGDAIGDLATSGLRQGKAIAETAGQTITGLFGRAKDIVKDKIGGDDEALVALQTLVAAQDGLTMAITMGDDKGIAIAKQSLVDAWIVARKVAAAG